MKKTMMTAAVLVAAIAGTSAQAEGTKRGKEFEPITRSEMVERSAARFDKMDSNGDGVLSHDEMRAARKKHADGKGWKDKKDRPTPFARMDTDGDGKIGADEFNAATAAMAKRHGKEASAERAAKRFEKLDTDGSGDLSAKELEAVKKKHRTKDEWKAKKEDRKAKRMEKKDH